MSKTNKSLSPERDGTPYLIHFHLKGKKYINALYYHPYYTLNQILSNSENEIPKGRYDVKTYGGIILDKNEKLSDLGIAFNSFLLLIPKPFIIPIMYRHSNVLIGKFKIFKDEYFNLLKTKIIQSKNYQQTLNEKAEPIKIIKDIEIYEISLLDDGTFGAGFTYSYETLKENDENEQ